MRINAHLLTHLQECPTTDALLKKLLAKKDAEALSCGKIELIIPVFKSARIKFHTRSNHFIYKSISIIRFH